MMNLKKGDCEHCGRFYRYSLWNSGFGNNSYAYCDQCGMLAVLNYSNPIVAELPEAAIENEEIDRSWESFLKPCPCGGRFRKGAFPRCPTCNERLSATHAAEHIEAQAIGAGRNWRWQNNWSGLHCMAIENPQNPGSLLMVENPVGAEPEPTIKAKSSWFMLFKKVRETTPAKPV